MTAKDLSPKTVIYNQGCNLVVTLQGFPYGTRFGATVHVEGHGSGRITRVQTTGTKQEPTEVEITLDQ